MRLNSKFLIKGYLFPLSNTNEMRNLCLLKLFDQGKEIILI